MSGKSPSKDEALEALDFIVNVLKEHEKDLDRLVSELGCVAGQLGDSGELSSKVKTIEDKMGGLQSDVGNLLKSLAAPSTSQSEETPVAVEGVSKEVTRNETARSSLPSGLPLILQCKQWEDFQNIAAEAQTVSFTIKESEKSFEVDALKNNHVITFSGEIPKLSALLKLYLSKQLGISEKQILEGDMALG